MAYISFQPTDFFKTVIWTGTQLEHAITGVGFSSDFTWIKARSDVLGHYLFDTVRGATYAVATNSSEVEFSDAQYLQSWQSDGFTLGTNSAINGTGDDVVGWNWKGGTTSGIATNGSTTITPSAYSFSADAGISILKYTGNDTAGAKVAHGLGAVPKAIIIKSTASTNSWNGYHVYNGATKYMILDSTESVNTNTNRWNDTEPDSVNFTLGSTAAVNGNDNNYIAYCFAEKKGYSRFGTFTGTGQLDAPFIPLGFRAAFFMYKRVDAAAHWTFHTNKIDGYNEVTKSINANEDNAESTSTGDNDIDICASGVKLREDNTHINASGASYIYIAFAEFPFVSSNGKAGVAR